MTASRVSRRNFPASSIRGAIVAALAATVGATSGCHSASTSRGSGAAFGTTTYIVQTAPRDPTASPTPGDDSAEKSDGMSATVDYFLPARPLGVLAPAHYPAKWMADGPESVAVAVVLKISESGTVTGIDLDPLAFSTPMKSVEDFVAALRAVAPEWEFVPAAVMTTTATPDSDGASTLEKRTVASELSVQFTFLRVSNK